MTSGAQHYREAERLARVATDYTGLPSNHNVQAGQLAQVHAMLAIAAATALNGGEDGGVPAAEFSEWREVCAKGTPAQGDEGEG